MLPYLPYKLVQIQVTQSFMDLLDLSQLTHEQVKAIWNLADQPDQALKANVAWSCEGNGIRPYLWALVRSPANPTRQH